jgi:hypothetical protein
LPWRGCIVWRTERTDTPEQNLFRNEADVREHYEELGVDLAKAASVMGISEDRLVQHALENSHREHGETKTIILTYAANGDNVVPTSYLSAEQIKKIVRDEFGAEGLDRLLGMNIAFPYDRSLLHPEHPDEALGRATIGRIISPNDAMQEVVKFSSEPGEMVYVGRKGESPEEFEANKAFLKDVVQHIERTPPTSVVLQKGDYLAFPNLPHRRETVPIAPDKRNLRAIFRTVGREMDSARNPQLTEGYQKLISSAKEAVGAQRER